MDLRLIIVLACPGHFKHASNLTYIATTAELQRGYGKDPIFLIHKRSKSIDEELDLENALASICNLIETKIISIDLWFINVLCMCRLFDWKHLQRVHYLYPTLKQHISAQLEGRWNNITTLPFLLILTNEPTKLNNVVPFNVNGISM